MAATTVNDFYLRFVNRNAAEAGKMKALYGATVFFGIAGTGLGIAMINVKSALDAWWMLAGVFSGGMLGLFLLGFLSRHARRPAAMVAVAVGVLVILWMSLSPKWSGSFAALRSPFHGLLTIVFGTAALLLTGLLITSLGASRRKNGAS